MKLLDNSSDAQNEIALGLASRGRILLGFLCVLCVPCVLCVKASRHSTWMFAVWMIFAMRASSRLISAAN